MMLPYNCALYQCTPSLLCYCASLKLHSLEFALQYYCAPMLLRSYPIVIQSYCDPYLKFLKFLHFVVLRSSIAQMDG